ncbi:hypothetical protein [Pararhodonellum marinum]|uniref:hypothetical protein n=1 Tax=Pararhodonellum marinum TaxID=2755358 RepID=UPI00188E2EC4|nr:hypothetical protein [Pararhodonellum marinum]
MKKFYFVILIGLFFSCQKDGKQPVSNPVQIDKYFPIQTLLQEQIDQLEGRSVEKTTTLKGESITTIQEMDEAAWRKELDLFVQSDINKASLALSYETVEENNQLIHRLKPGEKGEIQEVKVSYEGDQVVELQIRYHDENNFYRSSSTATIQICPATGLMKGYEVTGLQKVWFKPPNEMNIKAVLLPV